jgi:hypothetical protein
MPVSQSLRNALCFALSLMLLYLAMFCGACVPAANAQSQIPTRSRVHPDIPPTVTPVALGPAGAGGGIMQASDGNYYGTSITNGLNGYGFIYRVTPDGTMTDFYDFTGGSDGCSPGGALVEAADGNLYGANACSVIFSISLDGVLKSHRHLPSPWIASSIGFFPANDGNLYLAVSEVILSDSYGGLLRFNPSTGGMSIVYTSDVSVNGTNFYGVQASDGLIYFTNYGDGADSLGTINSIALDSSSYRLIHTFGTGFADGAFPVGSMVEGPDGNLYGTTEGGGNASGSSGSGVLYFITVGAIAPMSYHTQQSLDSYQGQPQAQLFLAGDHNFYGTGFYNGGSLFQYNYIANLLYDLYDFYSDPGTTGSYPALSFPLEGSDGNLYLSTIYSGPDNSGAVLQFGMSPALPAALTLASSGPGLVGESQSFTFSAANAFSLSMQQCNAFAKNQTTGDFYPLGAVSAPLSGELYSGSFSLTPFRGGSYTVGVTCGGIESATTGVLVSPEPSTTGLAIMPTTSDVTIGGPVSFYAEVEPLLARAVINEGSVSISCAGHFLGSSAVTNDVALITIPSANYPVGTYPCVALYSDPTGNFLNSTSNGQMNMVKQTSSVNLTPVGTTYDQYETAVLTATVTGENSTPTSGSVTFRVGSIILGTIPVDNAGTAVLSYTTYCGDPAGNYTVTATYGGSTTTSSSRTNAHYTLKKRPSGGPGIAHPDC